MKRIEVLIVLLALSIMAFYGSVDKLHYWGNIIIPPLIGLLALFLAVRESVKNKKRVRIAPK